MTENHNKNFTQLFHLCLPLMFKIFNQVTCLLTSDLDMILCEDLKFELCLNSPADEACTLFDANDISETRSKNRFIIIFFKVSSVFYLYSHMYHQKIKIYILSRFCTFSNGRLKYLEMRRERTEKTKLYLICSFWKDSAFVAHRSRGKEPRVSATLWVRYWPSVN